MQMCEAFAQTTTTASGAARGGMVNVTLYAARRINTPALRTIRDVWAFYGVDRAFTIRRVPCLDLFGVSGGRAERLVFTIQTATYLMILCLILLCRAASSTNRVDVYYSRDPLTLVALSLFVPRSALCYEAHQLSGSRWQTLCLRRVGTIIAVTAALADKLRERTITTTSTSAPILVAHDGIRAARFVAIPDQAEARRQLELPAQAFIVGYIGRLHTLGMSKGVDTLIDAIACLSPDPVTLCLVGGPDDWADRLRAQWIAHGLAPDGFIYVASVPADRVPLYLSAFDVGTMPLPWTEHFAYYASSLKLFEYMAAGRPLLATDLPSAREVVRDEYSALLVPPGDAASMAGALRRLKDDPALRQRLAEQAQRAVAEYHWSRRAERILDAVQQAAHGGIDS